MLGKTLAACCGVLMVASIAAGEAPRFHWQTGQVLVYRTENHTIASNTMGENKFEEKTHVVAIKRWQVMGVDAAGVATLQMSFQALLYEMTPSSGTPLVFDSAHLDQSTPELRKQLEDRVGQPQVTIRIDGQGKVIEVKEARPGNSLAKYECDPAFKVVLPAEPLQMGLSWDRPYQIVLEPPQGTGDEKYAAVQHYACKSVAGTLATVDFTTELKEAPAAQGDQVPLWQIQPQGEVVFDLEAGRLQKAVLRIDKEAKIEGGSSRLQSIYTEQFVGDR